MYRKALLCGFRPVAFVIVLIALIGFIFTGYGSILYADDTEGVVIRIIRDAMVGRYFELQVFKNALESIPSISKVEIVDNDLDLDLFGYLFYYPQGPRKYMLDHLDANRFDRRTWTIYLACVDKFDGHHISPMRTECLGHNVPNFDGKPQMIIVYVGEVREVCEDLTAICPDLQWNWTHACNVVALHEFGHLVGLEEVTEEQGEDPCRRPEKIGIMVEHVYTLTLDGFSAEEREALKYIQRPW